MTTSGASRAGHLTRTAALALAVAVAVAGCAGERIARPTARPDPDRPTFVDPATDPARDPQLAALELPEDRAGAESPTAVEDLARDLSRLPAMLTSVRAELGADTEVVQLDVGATVELYVSTAKGVDRASTGPDGELLRVPLQGGAADRYGGRAFALSDVDPEVPARVIAGIARRVPGAGVGPASLSTADPAAVTIPGNAEDSAPAVLAWRFTVTRGGRSAVVVADVRGAVLEVRT